MFLRECFLILKSSTNKKDILAENVSQLQLALHHERQTSSKLVTSINVNDRSNPLAVEKTVPRTCQEAILADSSLNSGMYWIDPDGQGYGDAPIYVYCDMSKGKRFVFSSTLWTERKNSFSFSNRNRNDIHFSRHWIGHGRWKLRCWRMLFKGGKLQRNSKANVSTGRFVRWMPSVN